MRFDNDHVGVVGLGESGLACVRWLLTQGARVVVIDSCAHPPHAQALADLPNVTLRCGHLTYETLAETDLLVVSPGVPLSTPAIAAFIRDGGEVIGDVELFARAIAPYSSKIIAITGSNGKSTVTALVEHLCCHAGVSARAAGNIGLPVLAALMQCERLGALPEVWVLELSSFQLDTTKSLNAHAATVLNISEDHLDRYDDLLHYAYSKSAVFRGTGVQVLNHADPLVSAMARAGRVIRWFSLSSATDYGLVKQQGSYWLTLHGEPVFNCARLPLQGSHNLANALAALALCEAVGIQATSLLEGFTTFRGLPHRVEWIGEVNGVGYIDDSKATNVGATQAALIGMNRSVVLIAGGVGKEQDFGPLKVACQRIARAVVLIGHDAPKIRAALSELAITIVECATLPDATRTAATLAQSGDIVLLSPACSSLDMFKNYVQRAQVFRDTVQQLMVEASI